MLPTIPLIHRCCLFNDNLQNIDCFSFIVNISLHCTMDSHASGTKSTILVYCVDVYSFLRCIRSLGHSCCRNLLRCCMIFSFICVFERDCFLETFATNRSLSLCYCRLRCFQSFRTVDAILLWSRFSYFHVHLP